MDTIAHSLSLTRINKLITEWKEYGLTDDNRQALRDMLTDVLHYCDAESLDFAEICDASLAVYYEELHGESI